MYAFNIYREKLKYKYTHSLKYIYMSTLHEIKETVCLPCKHYRLMLITVHYWLKCMICQNATVVVKERTHCPHDFMYVLGSSYFCKIRAVYMSWITHDQ